MLVKMQISLITLFSALFFLISVNCSKEENPTGPDSDNSLVGDWKLTTMISEHQGVKDTLRESQIDSMGLIRILKFENDGSVEQTTNLSDSLVTLGGT